MESAEQAIREWGFQALALWHRMAAEETGQTFDVPEGHRLLSVAEIKTQLRTLTHPVAELVEAAGLDSTPLWDFGSTRMQAPGDAFTVLKRAATRLKIAAAVPAAPPSESSATDRLSAKYIGNRKYQVGDDAAIVLQESEDHVLRSLIALGSASLTELRNQSGKDDAARVLKSIVMKHHPLANFITLPGGKGKGGYRTTIIDAT